MATKIVTYECEQCGTEVVVTEALGSSLQPIYCCGIAVAEVTRPAPRKTKSPKKAGAKVAAKKGQPARKRTAAKGRKTSKK